MFEYCSESLKHSNAMQSEPKGENMALDSGHKANGTKIKQKSPGN